MASHNVTIEDSSPLFNFSSGWVDSPIGNPDYHKYSGYAVPDWASFHETNVTASFDLAFNGTAIYIFGTQSSVGGPFSVTLTDTDASGATINTVDSSSGTSQGSTTVYQSLLYSHTGLKAGTPHNLHVENGGKGQFILEFAIVQNEIGTSGSVVQNITIDDENPAFTYGGGFWNESLSSPDRPDVIVTKYWNNGSERYTRDRGATVKLDFAGSGVEVHGTWFDGNVSVVLDGQSYGSVISHSNFSMYNRPRELIWFVDGLNEGKHTVEMTNLEFENGIFNGGYFGVDYAIVYTAGQGNNATSLPANTTSGGAGAKQTGHGDPTLFSPYNVGLLILFFWMMSRSRLL